MASINKVIVVGNLGRDTPETLPWRAERMLGPVYVPTGMAYRGQRA